MHGTRACRYGYRMKLRVPPLLVVAVMDRAAGGAAVRAGKARAALEVEEQVDALSHPIELGAGERPARYQTEGLLEELLHLAHTQEPPWWQLLTPRPLRVVQRNHSEQRRASLIFEPIYSATHEPDLSWLAT